MVVLLYQLLFLPDVDMFVGICFVQLMYGILLWVFLELLNPTFVDERILYMRVCYYNECFHSIRAARAINDLIKLLIYSNCLINLRIIKSE